MTVFGLQYGHCAITNNGSHVPYFSFNALILNYALLNEN